MCKIDLFHQNKHDHQLFSQILSEFFEKQHKIRSFEWNFGYTKGFSFESCDYSKGISSN